MLRKFGAFFLILFILIFSVNSQVKDAQAFFVVDDAIEISIIAGMLVESGAVGDIEEVGTTYSGALWTSAVNLMYEMGPDLQTAFQQAVTRTTNGYFLLSSCPGLSAYINGHITAKDYSSPTIDAVDTGNITGVLAPTVTSTFNPSLYFHDFTIGVMQNSSLYGGIPHLQISLDSLASPTLYYSVDLTTNGTTITGYSSARGGTGTTAGYFNDTIDNNLTYIDANIASAVLNYCSSTIIGQTYTPSSNKLFTNITYNSPSLNPATGTFSPTISPATPITDSMPVSIPANPLALNNATISTQYTNTAGVTSGVLGNSTQTALGTSAATAAQAAYNAAIAAGLTVNQALAAAKAASAAIASGLTAAQAASAGAAAATQAGTAAASGALTTDIANTQAGDTINWNPLKLAADAFTNRFPFSLPWDFYHMISTFASPPATPSFSIVGDSGVKAGFKVNSSMDLSQFNDAVASIRVFEKILFSLALLWGTRKLLGGGV